MADKPTFEQKRAMLETLDGCDRDSWIAIVRYCAPELISEQKLLAEIICRRAEKIAAIGHQPADHISSVLDDAQLQIVLGKVTNE
jgi:hypothetical protein